MRKRIVMKVERSLHVRSSITQSSSVDCKAMHVSGKD